MTEFFKQMQKLYAFLLLLPSVAWSQEVVCALPLPWLYGCSSFHNSWRLGSVLVSYCYSNKLPQFSDLKPHGFTIYSSGDQKPKISIIGLTVKMSNSEDVGRSAFLLEAPGGAVPCFSRSWRQPAGLGSWPFLHLHSHQWSTLSLSDSASVVTSSHTPPPSRKDLCDYIGSTCKIQSNHPTSKSLT